MTRGRFHNSTNELLVACLGFCLAGLAAVGLPGCDETKKGPKRADHEAAHTERYHPEIVRDHRRTRATAAEASPASQPSTQAAASPGSGSVGPGSVGPGSVGPGPVGPGPVGTPVLFVNSDSVTVPDVLEPIVHELETEAESLSPQAYAYSMQRAIRREVDQQISALLVYQEAMQNIPEQALAQIDKEVDKRVKEAVTDRYGGVFARYEAQLEAMELTMDDVRARIKRQIMVTTYMRDKFRPMLREPARRHLYRYYREHIDQYTTPEKAEMFLIEIPVDAVLGKARHLATADEIAAARDKAVAQLERAREELESGVEFAAVARAYGKGIKARQGGAWGEIGPDTLRGRWAKAGEVLFTLTENQISGVVTTDENAFIVKCGKRTPARVVSFEEAQASIIDRMKEEQFDQLTRDYMEGLMAKATIRPFQEFLQAAYAAAPRPAPPSASTDDAEE